jgi:hypothetical protein
MINRKIIIISVALVLATPALCQNHNDAEAINNLAEAINNYEAGVERRHEDQQFRDFVRSHGYAPNDPCKGTHSSWACQ